MGRKVTYECMNACFVSQSVIHQVLNASNGVFKRKRSMEKQHSLKKGKGCVIIQAKRQIKIIVKFRAENKFGNICIMHQTSF